MDRWKRHIGCIMLMDARRFAVTECNGLSHGARIHISEILDEGNKRQEYEHTLVQVLSNQLGSTKTSRTEFGQQMRSRELPAYLSLNRLLNSILSYS